MQITLNTKEFDEAVLLWLKKQGFTTDRYDISTRVIAGRSDGPLGTRLEVTLDPVENYHPPLTPPAGDWEEAYEHATSPRKFGVPHE